MLRRNVTEDTRGTLGLGVSGREWAHFTPVVRYCQRIFFFDLDRALLRVIRNEESEEAQLLLPGER
jgi:hypothetical protein